MTTDIINWLDIIKTHILALEEEINNKNNDINNIQNKNTELTDDLDNLKKVSLVSGLTRQLDERNNKINFLTKQLDNLKKAPTKFIEPSPKILTDDSLDEKSTIDIGYEIINFEDTRLLKNIENRKLYYLSTNDSKGKYAGKISNKGKIKLKD
jgi:septal ring factor EnvC (AmiA/AmiB activator)